MQQQQALSVGARATRAPQAVDVFLGAERDPVGSPIDGIHINIITIGSMYGIYANIGGILMVNVTIYSIHGSYGITIDFGFTNIITIYYY